MRPTIQMIEPEIYSVYRLVLENNVSTQRTLKLWEDTKSSYYERDTGRGKIKALLERYTEDFWKANNAKVMSEITDVIEFMSKFQPKWWKFW